MWRALPDFDAEDATAPERDDPRRDVDPTPRAHRASPAQLSASGRHGAVPPARRPDRSAHTDPERSITTHSLRSVGRRCPLCMI